ncbi:nucleotidyltransferase [Chitinophaga agrisoli]|uniref:Nucleotidyltransferase n=1 Tax=Chitinophaga agrisoli TaxID=2607653 RepID=A0A5B2W257_9BACT|nr:nucleotidyltransferase domain-containing protein [Chitinophaga agrisoli]KAA2244830.1 nucleotidyltransferase [Chitinophaga agrisoli]
MTIAEMKQNGWLLLECVSGSKAYGLDTPTSDTDLKGVYYLPKEQFYGLDGVTQLTNETNDEVYYELGRFLELLLKNNPNILELLATPEDEIRYRHPIMEQLQVDMFLSKLCKDTFAGYAITQVQKARGYKKKIVNPIPKERKAVPDFCYVLQGHTTVPLQGWLAAHDRIQQRCGLSSVPHAKGMYALFYDADGTFRYNGIVSGPAADDVSLSPIPKGQTVQAYMSFNQEGYSAYCKEYREYWDWVELRNEHRYQGNMAHGKGYDAKNMMHTIRLLQVAVEIARENKLQVKRPNREELLSIKAGNYSYEELLQKANVLMEEITTAYPASTLRDVPDKEKITAILVHMRDTLYHS